ncbi:major facilitator superfamily domain-containing protein [Ditylenchus destructor]|nr:major facilitator superfamily domain-containing protein [Ditylenchus destructor]
MSAPTCATRVSATPASRQHGGAALSPAGLHGAGLQAGIDYERFQLSAYVRNLANSRGPGRRRHRLRHRRQGGGGGTAHHRRGRQRPLLDHDALRNDRRPGGFPLARPYGGDSGPQAGAASWYTLAVLLVATILGSVDAMLVTLLTEPMRATLALSDTQIGMLKGAGLVLFTGLATLPLGWLGDRYDRRLVLAACVLVWSAATGLRARRWTTLCCSSRRSDWAWARPDSAPSPTA